MVNHDYMETPYTTVDHIFENTTRENPINCSLYGEKKKREKSLTTMTTT